MKFSLPHEKKRLPVITDTEAAVQELAYLGKKRFTPDPNVYALLGIKEGQRYIIVRFTGRTAVHDIGCRGLTPEMKYLAVKEFSKYAGRSEKIHPKRHFPSDAAGHSGAMAKKAGAHA